MKKLYLISFVIAVICGCSEKNDIPPFEVFDTGGENNRSLFGGGRYDNLLDIFDLPRVPAVGFGMGDVTLRDVLETYNLIPEFDITTGVYIGIADQTSRVQAHSLAQELRNLGVTTITDLKLDKFANQFKRAQNAHITHFVFVGEDEATSGMYRLKNLTDDSTENVTKDTLLAILKTTYNA